MVLKLLLAITGNMLNCAFSDSTTVVRQAGRFSPDQTKPSCLGCVRAWCFWVKDSYTMTNVGLWIVMWSYRACIVARNYAGLSPSICRRTRSPHKLSFCYGMCTETRQRIKLWSLYIDITWTTKLMVGKQNVFKHAHLSAQIHKGMSDVLSQAKRNSRQNNVRRRVF